MRQLITISICICSVLTYSYAQTQHQRLTTKTSKIEFHCGGDNEHYSECGSDCEPTCDNYHNPPVCADSCVAGCFCKFGYVRSKDNRCVTRNECHLKKETTVERWPRCPSNQRYYTCDECEAACDHFSTHRKHLKGRCLYAYQCNPKKKVYSRGRVRDDDFLDD